MGLTEAQMNQIASNNLLLHGGAPNPDNPQEVNLAQIANICHARQGTVADFRSAISRIGNNGAVDRGPK